MSELDILRGLKTGTVESVGLSFLPSLIVEFSRRHQRLIDETADVGSGFLTTLARDIHRDRIASYCPRSANKRLPAPRAMHKLPSRRAAFYR
ncbi:hypothetical protein [Ensifer sp. ENS12]|uniref:hypothetical protein n=1 Tax=Ensifer sp. ENS12 TaxID=2854774 RepID=UPI001C45EB92|nr:hypothetical protein [Ensifer sp. ENS12]MBV7522143.1 hypothetical protein [Ensifer sp. ENS12]